MDLVPLIRGLIFTAWVGWLLLYWQGGSAILADIQQALREPRTRLDAALLVSITSDALVILVAGALVLLRVFTVSPAWDMLSAAGALIVLAGIAGTFYARQHLGPAWTAETRTGEGQGIVDQGPYGVVRHPIYTAAIGMYIGLGLVFPLWWNGLAVASIVIGYIFKTYDEDRYLMEHLPGYRDYADRVRYRLLPGVW